MHACTMLSRDGEAGLRTLTTNVQHTLDWRKEPYSLTLYFAAECISLPSDLNSANGPKTSFGSCMTRSLGVKPEFSPGLHKLQQIFRLNAFAVLAPFSFSGRVLDMDEATILLSTLCTALSNCGKTRS
eukprot:8267797-Pyramimonas_sp.AAC.1